jgi:drug/metabolite transporter (DMT)-like permease
MEPVIAIGAAFIILDESIGIVQVLGGLMVLGALGLLQLHPMIMRTMVKVE